MAKRKAYIYDSGIVRKALAYIEDCEASIGKLPTVDGLCNKLKINTDTWVDWVNKYEEVEEINDYLKNLQRDRLINDGLYGGKEVNGSMAIFLLKAVHGLKETSVVENKDMAEIEKLKQQYNDILNQPDTEGEGGADVSPPVQD